MANYGNENKKSGDGMYAILGFAAILAICIYLLWLKNRKTIIFILYAFDYFQYWIVYLLSYIIPNYGQDSHKWIYYIQNVFTGKYDASTMNFSELLATQADIGQKTFLFYTAACGYFIYKVKNNMLGDGIKRDFSLIGGKNKTSFIDYQAKYWTEAKFAVGFDPEKEDKRLAPPMKPIPWLLENKVTYDEKNGLDKNKLEDLFTKQVGEKYKSFEQCPFYIQAFLALCMITLQHGGEDGKINKFRRDLNNIFYDKKLKENEIKTKILGVINDFCKFDVMMVKEIDRIVKESHFYINTACLGIIGWCGPFKNWGGGYGQIISPAMYLWLMKYDRTLFMALQAHGKFGICSYIEGAGVISHYLLERGSASPVSSIYVTSAINGVQENLDLHNITNFDDMKKSWARIDRRYKLNKIKFK